MVKRCIFFLIVISLSCSSLAISELDCAKTKYPIVLVHGMFGFGGSLLGLISYWGNIPKVLKKFGAEVFIAEVSQAHDIETCGEQLYQQLKKWKRSKYNLVGHSFGGLASDYVSKKYPDSVVSVTTMGTPHQGCKMADLAYYCINMVPQSHVFWQAGNMACFFFGLLSGNWHRQDLQKAVRCLTSEAKEISNSDIPKETEEDDKCVRYSCGSYDIKPAGIFDVCGISFYILGRLLYGDKKNDGVVDHNSMKYGNWIGTLEGAHHLIHLNSLFEQFILEHAKRLKDEGR